MSWIDNLQWSIVLILGGLLLLAPFTPEPHLVEKLHMLSQGELVKPQDIFDLLMHGSPALVIGIKAFRQFVLKVEKN
ncbi:hypothetical protein [Vibrio algarum]|uniref:RND transporter n=1 Tax=Vibrio algarum TaxID=3020714 RepID=A0ABT4YWW4_9VIBR|nr:hypothetical protein [Vibrio sp. KJ40-1]MDB1125988.1 hypothetical protein [Vibrio sp. KJ40-1]